MSFNLNKFVNNANMSKFKFVNIIDTIFLSFATFLIIFAWVQFFVKNLLLSLFISAILAIATILTIRFFKNKKYLAKQSEIANSANLIRFKLAIQTLPNTKLATIIKNLIPAKYFAKSVKGDIVFNKQDNVHAFTFYYSAQLTDTKLLELIKTKKCDRLVVFCSSFNQDAKLISSAFKDKKIELVDLEQLYHIFNKHNIHIDTTNIDLNKSKISILDILKNSISRNKSKGYFLSGLILLFTSIIIPYKIYYVIFSSILFLLSLLCRLRPNISTNHSIFD